MPGSGWTMGVKCVWAPYARQVLMVLDGASLIMEAAGGGWWFLDSDWIEHGKDYAFVLDGSAPLPDPRSPWQPCGVHGFSRIVVHSLFPWTDGGWHPPALSRAVIYELHVGTFSPQGTFAGVEGFLDYLVWLGVTHVELMPVASFPGRRGWGYDGVDLFAPQEAYGGPAGLKHLVDACHAKGLAVILDVVYNHLGPDGNYLERFGPYFSPCYCSPWGKAMNFDGPGSDEVRRFFVDNALMWLKDYHMDALRLDAIHTMVDTSAVPFLEELSGEVDALEERLGRSFSLIAESNLNDPKVVEPREKGGIGMDAQWNDDFHHALHTVLTGEANGYYADYGSIRHIAKALKGAFVLDGGYSSFRGRRHGRKIRGLEGDRFLAYLQTHDQVGNRAKGERAGHLMSLSKLMIASALVFFSPFIPMLFQGEEWDASSPFLYFADHRDQDLRRAVSEGRMNEFASFGWNPGDIPDPGAEETFERSKLQWEEQVREPHMSVLSWYRSLIDLRRTTPDLEDGSLGSIQVECDEARSLILVKRGRMVIACNLSPEGAAVGMPGGGAGGEVLLASRREIELHSSELSLPPESVAVVALAHP
jgi:maltooligosyltrehalose trehalohydrolase